MKRLLCPSRCPISYLSSPLFLRRADNETKTWAKTFLIVLLGLLAYYTGCTTVVPLISPDSARPCCSFLRPVYFHVFPSTEFSTESKKFLPFDLLVAGTVYKARVEDLHCQIAPNDSWGFCWLLFHCCVLVPPPAQEIENITFPPPFIHLLREILWFPCPFPFVGIACTLFSLVQGF